MFSGRNFIFQEQMCYYVREREAVTRSPTAAAWSRVCVCCALGAKTTRTRTKTAAVMLHFYEQGNCYMAGRQQM
jgi:hypothetical protein